MSENVKTPPALPVVYCSQDFKDRVFELCGVRGTSYSKLVLKLLENELNPKMEEPYFGWCDVEGCNNEGANGGCCWSETGYWTVCTKHSSEFRAGKVQPKMKQSAIEREATRGEDGCLPYNK